MQRLNIIIPAYLDTYLWNNVTYYSLLTLYTNCDTTIEQIININYFII